MFKLTTAHIQWVSGLSVPVVNIRFQNQIHLLVVIQYIFYKCELEYVRVYIPVGKMYYICSNYRLTQGYFLYVI